MPQCYVDSCRNYYEKTRGSKDIIYHMLPSDPIVALKWVKACGKKDQNLPYYARVCSDHFSEKCYQRDLQHELLGLPLRRKLKSGAVPDINLPKQKPKSTVSKLPVASGTITKIQPSKDQVHHPKKKILPSTTLPKTIVIDDSSPEEIELTARNASHSSTPKIYSFPKQLQNRKEVWKSSKVPMRSSYRIAKKKSIESLSDSFTEKVNSKSQKWCSSRPEKFSDKLKFMAKLQLRLERKNETVTLPKYGLEESLKKVMKKDGFNDR